MKNIFVISLLLMMLFACKSTGDADPGTFTLLNGSAEKGFAGPSGWGRKEGDNVYFIWAKNEFHSGERSLKIQQKKPKRVFSAWTQTVSKNIPHGEKLTLRVFIRTEDVKGPGVVIAMRGDITKQKNGSGEMFVTSHRKKIINGSADWMEYSISFKEPIRNDIKSITVSLILLKKTTGSVYFDDVELITGDGAEKTLMLPKVREEDK